MAALLQIAAILEIICCHGVIGFRIRKSAKKSTVSSAEPIVEESYGYNESFDANSFGVSGTHSMHHHLLTDREFQEEMDFNASAYQIVPLQSHVGNRSETSSELLTMGSMVMSEAQDAFEDVDVVSFSGSQNRMLQYGSNSDAVRYQQALAPTANIEKLHYIDTQLAFYSGNLEHGLRRTNYDQAAAKTYGEGLKSEEQCEFLAAQIKEMQMKTIEEAPGSRFLICVALGTSSTVRQLTKEGRPDFALNRARNIKHCMEEALDVVGAEAIVDKPLVYFKKHRVAALLMKSYTGDRPPCVAKDLNLPDPKKKPEVKPYLQRSVRRDLEYH